MIILPLTESEKKRISEVKNYLDDLNSLKDKYEILLSAVCLNDKSFYPTLENLSDILNKYMR